MSLFWGEGVRRRPEFLRELQSPAVFFQQLVRVDIVEDFVEVFLFEEVNLLLRVCAEECLVIGVYAREV
jgi:hypothetical protein